MNAEEKREIIMDHYRNPINKKENNNAEYLKQNSKIESCIDDINISVLFDGNIIKDITFDGEACAISTASTSIMVKNLIGKTIEEVNEFIINYENMINEEDYNKDILIDALVFDEVYKQKSRKNCALLPYKAMKKIVSKKGIN